MKRWRWWAWVLLVAGIGLILRFATGFPWRETADAIVGTSLPLVLGAVVLNLVAFAAKAWAWHLLLRPVAPNRWRTAQEAMLIGAAVNSISVSVSGEAARVHHMVQRDEVPLAAALSSVLWSRVVEAIALTLFLLLVAWLFPLPDWMRTVRLTFGLSLIAVALVTLLGGWATLLRGLPLRVSGFIQPLVDVAGRGRLTWPIVLDLVNWFAEWATFHLCIVATGTPAPYVVSLVALVAANIAGAPRLTPANVGVLQASVVVGMLPFGIAPERAVAGGLVLQAALVLPVLALGAGIVGWKGLRGFVAPNSELHESV